MPKKKKKRRNAEPDPLPAEAKQEALPENANEPSELESALEEFQSKAARLEEENAELRGLAQRQQADFENFRKRVERERGDALRAAGSDLVKTLLPILDNLERAIEASRSGSEDSVREGVTLIHRQLKEVLEREGLEEIAASGERFDPHVHEAVSGVETEEYPEGTVVTVFQRGYRFRDRLLRPSMVSVAHRPSESQESSETEDEDEDEVVSRRD